MKRYDSIIIGAGHNGLVCAGYLAKAGQQVLVLESAEVPGGLAAAREFHSGFKVSIAHSVSHFPARICSNLGLDKYGFGEAEMASALTALSPDGNHIVVQGESVSGVSSEDAASYRNFTRQMRRFAQALGPFWLKTIPRAAFTSFSDLVTFAKIGLKLRLLGRDDMREFMRIAALPARDLVDENFENEALKSMVCWDGLIGSKIAPRSPNSAVLPMLYRLSGSRCGQPDALIKALTESAVSRGVEIRTNAPVDRILVRGDTHGLTARGVVLRDGEQIEADRVVSSADPQTTFLRLVGVENLEIEFTNRIRRLRCDGFVAKLHLALDGLPEFTGLENVDGRILIAPKMDVIEFAYDDAKYGECSQQPVMEITMPSLIDSSLAPAGKHVLSAHVMYVPYSLKGGWTDAARDTIRDRVIDVLAQYAPGIREQIIHSELLTPEDLENNFNVSGGHWHHIELAPDQALMMRPTYQAAQYSTPLPGLFLCGAGCHPGGDLTGAPGHNAAQEILR